ncbi:retrovirus-related pol polyprotein from transposon TNT 1-94 [Tanacetum coccineum]
MLKIDVEPITPKLLNKKIAHSAYIKHTQEEATVLKDLVEHVKLKYPLDQSLESVCRYAKRIQESLTNIRVKPSTSASGSQPSGNTKKDKIQQTPSSTQMNKVEAHPRKVKFSLKNKDCVVKPKGTAHVQHSKLNANFELNCVKCNGCMLSDNHDLCVLDFINNVNAHTKSKSVIQKMQRDKFWKQTERCLQILIYQIPTGGGTYTIVRITTTTEGNLSKSKTNVPVSKSKILKSVFQIVLWYLDFGCSKHMIGDRSQIGNLTISRVYYVEGLGDNLFSIGQFCDSNLEVAFRQHTCFIRNLEGVDLLTGSRGNNLYNLSLGDMMVSFPKCLLHGLVRGFPKLKFEKDHLCSVCAMGKSKKKPNKPKSEDTNQEKLYLLHMDLCEPMRVASVNGKKYILVIVDDYSRFTWVKCLRSKDEAPYFIIKFLKMIAKFDLKYLPTRGTCYPTNDSENLGNLQPKADIDFDELTVMASEHSSSGPALHEMTPKIIISGLVPNPPPSTPFVPPLRTDWDILFQPFAPVPIISTGSPSSTTVDQDAPSPNVAHMNNDPFFGIPIPENDSEASSSSDVIPTVVMKSAAPYSEHIEAMQEELNEFEHLEVWELVPRPDKVMKGNQYEESFCSMAKLDAIGIFLAQPDGFMDQENPNHVYKLKKALYGLKQAHCAWYDLLSKFLLSQEFSKGTVDPTLFIRRQGNDLLQGVNVQIQVFRIMDTTRSQQKALDDELVAPENRLKIGKNLRLSSNLKSKEPTLQVALDALKLTPFYNAFEITIDVPEIYI